MRKNDFSDVSDFSKKRETILCAFVNAHVLHLLIFEIDSLLMNFISSTTVVKC